MPLCPGCLLRVDLCLCAEIPKIVTDTHVALIVHSLELKKATNTARLLSAALVNSEVRLQGSPLHPLNLSQLVSPERDTLILFPENSNPPLTPEFAATLRRPVTLIVPDGTWQQAKKIAAHASMLPGARRLSVPNGAPSRYRLRLSEQPARLCTMEAVARALGVLESPEIEATLTTLLDTMVERSMSMRKRGVIFRNSPLC